MKFAPTRSLVLVCTVLTLYCTEKKDSGNNASIQHKMLQPPSAEEFSGLQDSSKVGVLMLSYETDTLIIVSDGELTWRPLGNLSGPEHLRRLTKGFGEPTIEHIENPISGGKGMLIHFQQQKSFIKLYTAHKDAPQIIESTILDRQIELSYGIHVGMTKEEFFSTLFVDPSPKLHYFNVVENYDPPGEFIEETFVFRGDTLSEIIMKAPYTRLD